MFLAVYKNRQQPFGGGREQGNIIRAGHWPARMTMTTKKTYIT